MSKIDSLLPVLRGKLLEISIGDEYEELQMSDHVKKINGVIYGVLKDIVDDFLILDCYYINQKGLLSDGNIVYVNSWAIKVFTEVKPTGCLNDILLSSSHTRKMKVLLGLDE
jgi:hypothetical protein